MINRRTPTKDRNEEIRRNPPNGDLNSFLLRSNPESSLILSKMSPQTPSKISQNFFLNKKRYNADLNLTGDSPQAKLKIFDISYSPFATDTKITKYFPQKKGLLMMQNNLFGKTFGDSLFKKGDLNATSENTLPFAKKLNFDRRDIGLEKTLNLENYYNNNKFNIQFGNDTGISASSNNCQHTKNSNFNNLEFSDDSSDDNYSGLKGPSNVVIISHKTKEILKKIKGRKPKSKNLNLNLEKIIKKINKKSNSKLNSKTNSPCKKNSTNKKTSPLLQSVNKILNSNSMKDKYEELLSRELMLPCHFKSLLKKFSKLDETLNFFKNGQEGEYTTTSISKINSHFIQNYDSNFTQEEFQQILYITPHFFIYKWEVSREDSSNFELCIDIPYDIKKRQEDNYTDKTNFINMQTFPFIPLKTPLDNDLLNKRQVLFKKILLHLTSDHHRKLIKDKGITTKLNPFKHRTWHSEFDVHGVPTIELFKLIERPKKKM